MCGIVGLLYNDPQKTCSETTLVKMRDIMSHRGPDDKGIYIDGNLGLGHRRLSIIGLTTGRQPLTNEDNSLWIVFNGEIYNYLQLKENLIKKGHIFTTTTDTEVILHLYEEKGTDCVNDLNGMFAFAIWDKKNDVLFMARDRMGIKPLYYAQTKEAFLFSSEIKSLFASNCLVPECNDDAVPEYFLFKNVAGESTLFKGVKTLLAGHIMVLDKGKLHISQYWTPYPETINHHITLEEAIEELTFLLKDAIKIRLMSEVPLGTFCSGGIDSSLVTAIAAQTVQNPINTFSVGFHEEDYDETNYAQLVSKKYGTLHHEIKLDNKQFANLLPDMIWQNDEPLHFPNSVQIYAISKLAKEFVTVVLTGEGADELFAGYPRYQIPKFVASFQRFPKLVKKLLEIVNYCSNDHRIAKLKQFSDSSINDAILYNTTSLNQKGILAALSITDTDRFSYREQCIAKSEYMNDVVSQVSLLDQLTYLVSILYRQDKMSMAASVEARVPFLDYRLVEYANTLPVQFKLNGFNRKHIINKIAYDYLPSAIITRKKSGFGVPLDRWLRKSEGLGKLADELIYDACLSSYFNKQIIENIVKEHKSGSMDHSEFLWAAINFLIWKKNFHC